MPSTSGVRIAFKFVGCGNIYALINPGHFDFDTIREDKHWFFIHLYSSKLYIFQVILMQKASHIIKQNQLMVWFEHVKQQKILCLTPLHRLLNTNLWKLFKKFVAGFSSVSEARVYHEFCRRYPRDRRTALPKITWPPTEELKCFQNAIVKHRVKRPINSHHINQKVFMAALKCDQT